MRTMTLSDVMSQDVVTVDASLSLRELVELLSERHLGGVPVVEGRRLVGVVSAADVLNYLSSNAPAPVVAEGPAWDAAAAEDAGWSEGDDPPADFYTRLDLDEELDLDLEAMDQEPLHLTTVGDVMTRDLLTLPPDAPLEEAAKYMLWAEVHRVLVTERDELVGIVTTMDIVRAVAQHKV